MTFLKVFYDSKWVLKAKIERMLQNASPRICIFLNDARSRQKISVFRGKRIKVRKNQVRLLFF
jgi:hypothetical protein